MAGGLAVYQPGHQEPARRGQVPGRSDAGAPVRTRWAPISARPTPAQNRFRTFRTTASVTPCGRGQRQRRRQRARQRLVHADAERHELERDGDGAVQRLEHDRLRPRGAPLAHQPAERRGTPPAPPGRETRFPGPTRPRAARGGLRRTRAPPRAAAPAGRATPDAAPRSGDQVPRSSRVATTAPPAKSTSAASADLPSGGAQRHREQRHRHAHGHHADRRGRVDQVVHRQRRHGLRRRQPGAGQEHLGGLAGRQAERRHAADRVAGQERAERGAEGQAHAGAHAEPPGLCAEAEPDAADREDEQQPGAHAPDAVGDDGEAHAPDGVGEEEQSTQRRGSGEQELPAARRRMRAKRYWLQPRLSSGASASFDLLERVFDQPLVVVLRHVALQQLRRDGHRDVDRLVANLLERARGLHARSAARRS